ncbi:hypothetical protein E2C01_100568 [Portunus trituberculatus]|uniref:Uncharacterized protein n=1 Tax=Portunus trituberculatus TaxID=210409 RepID=A0A5B7KDW2_PORTR|nr:hypothetical protein [Portunus trituberculatus]
MPSFSSSHTHHHDLTAPLTWYLHLSQAQGASLVGRSGSVHKMEPPQPG